MEIIASQPLLMRTKTYHTQLTDCLISIHLHSGISLSDCAQIMHLGNSASSLSENTEMKLSDHTITSPSSGILLAEMELLTDAELQNAALHALSSNDHGLTVIYSLALWARNQHNTSPDMSLKNLRKSLLLTLMADILNFHVNQTVPD